MSKQDKKKAPYVAPAILTEVTATEWPAYARCSEGYIAAPDGGCDPVPI